MSSEAGPGPSSLTSSTVVPSSARKLRIKKRVINLVNPAGQSCPFIMRCWFILGCLIDPQDFSDGSISTIGSPEVSFEINVETPPRSLEEGVNQTFTPLGINKDGVRGILRPSGTPGSGNGGMQALTFFISFAKFLQCDSFPKTNSES
jgi:hypothetical protein